MTANEPSLLNGHRRGPVSQSSEQVLQPVRLDPSIIGWHLCPVEGCAVMFPLSVHNSHLRESHNMLVSVRIFKGEIQYQVCEVRISCFITTLISHRLIVQQCANVQSTGDTCNIFFGSLFTDLIISQDRSHDNKPWIQHKPTVPSGSNNIASMIAAKAPDSDS